jgi:hypothetical protein
MKLVLASLLCLLGSLGYWWMAAPGGEGLEGEASSFRRLPLPPGPVGHLAQVVGPLHLPSGVVLAPRPAPSDLEDEDEGELDDEPVAWVRGRVVVEGSGPLPEELEVFAFEESPDDAVHVGVEEDGEFEVELPAGRWTLVARAPELRPAVIEGFWLNEGETREREELTLRTGLQIRGRLLGAEGPPADVHVVVEGQGERRVLWTLEDGTFTARGLAPGLYRVAAQDAFEGSDEREVAAGDSVSLTLKRGTLRGVALGFDGRPIPGAQVLVLARSLPQVDEHPWVGESERESLSGWECLGADCSRLADAEGRFEVEVPPPRSRWPRSTGSRALR